MFRTAALLSFSFLAVVCAQQIGTLTAETHPPFTYSTCVAGGTCTSQTKSIVLDSNWRWLHSTSSSTNCYTGNTWDATLCPDPTTCATNCALDGADYEGTYGITASGDSLTLQLVTETSTGTNVGSRVYLMADSEHYEMFQLKNSEFTFDVDVSNLPCGLNGALYFVEMSADGGVAAYPTNKAGAQYGTGYCDSQCPQDIKFINGQANILGWTADSNDANAGTGQYGTCCNEMDVWEANSISTAFTPHSCNATGQTRCEGVQCGDGSDRANGICDKDGCDFNSFRMGNTSFYGPGKIIDTTSTFTVVTQFLTADNTSTGALSEIRRIYVQNGKVIQNSISNVAGVTPTNSITDEFCTQQVAAFDDTPSFETRGGLGTMSAAFTQGVVLVMSLWDDYAAEMLWLDSDYPVNASATAPGVARGTCATTSGNPTQVESQTPGASVVFSNIKFGPIGSTFSSGGSTSAPPPPTGGSGGAAHYAQCGGIGWTGATTCVSPYTCTELNDYYSQCL